MHGSEDTRRGLANDIENVNMVEASYYNPWRWTDRQSANYHNRMHKDDERCTVMVCFSLF